MNVSPIKEIARRGIGAFAPALWSLRRTPSLVILAYHRVLPSDHPDRAFEQPGMFVSPESFQMHVRELLRHFEVVDLSDWVVRVRNVKSVPARACAITLDDGWKDNFEYAFPILKQERCPSTIFLVADRIGSTYRFWPNRLARILRQIDRAANEPPPQLAECLGRVGIDVSRIGDGLRMAEIDAAISACKAVSDETLERLLCEWVGDLQSSELDRDILNRQELEEMRASQLVRFGSHTRRHTRLRDGLSNDVLEDEIGGSRQCLEQLLGEPVDLFCYPNGDMFAGAVEVVRRNYAAAVTTALGWNRPSGDLHMLRRISVHEDVAAGANSFLAKLAAIF